VNCLSFLGCPSDLLTVALVNSHFSDISAENSLWRLHCQREWRCRQITSFGSCLQEVSWKTKFFLSQTYKSRTVLTEGELVTLTWKFRFKEIAGTHINIHFTQNCLIMPGYPNMPWKIVQNNVYIAKFPPHTVSRDSHHWGWVIQNLAVVFWTFDEELLRIGQTLKEKGNASYAAENYCNAIYWYREALNYVNGFVVDSREYDGGKWSANGRYGLMVPEEQELRVTLLSNIAQVYIMQENYGLAIRYCDKVLKFAAHFPIPEKLRLKCFYRKKNSIEKEREQSRVVRHLLPERL